MAIELLHLKNTALAITERCTLKCKLCIAYIPYHVNPRDMAINEVETVLERYFSIVTSVDAFCVTGGEPLLHPDLLTILNMLNDYSDQINKTLDITTNGTLDISDKIISFLENNRNRTRVIIGDYGKYSPKAKTLTEKLRSLGINARDDCNHGDSPLYGGWIDDRDFSQKHFTQHAIDEQGQSCFYRDKGFPIRKGELHNCVRSYWRIHQKVVSPIPDEFIDLLDTSASIEEQRETLRSLKEKVSVSSCAYCWGTNDQSKRYPPAEQLDADSTSHV